MRSNDSEPARSDPQDWRSYWSTVKDALAGREQDFTRGPIRRAVMLLAIPMMLEMSMESVFAVVDIFFVARLGADAVAAVGLTEAVITPLYAIAIGLSTGATALVARRIGERRPEEASVVAGQVIWVGMVVAFGVGAAGILLGEDILRFMGAAPGVVENGSRYTQILLGGSITILFLFVLGGIFRGAGDATLAMRALWLANGLNLILDPLLIFGIGPFPELGVAGAAVATNIGRGTGVLFQLYCLAKGRGRLTLATRHLALRLSVLARLLRVSLGGILQYLIATSSWIVLVRIIAPYGSAAIAGYTIGLRVLELTFLPAWGLGSAAATLVGQNLGAGAPRRAEESVWWVVKYNVAFLVSVAIAIVAFAEPVASLFASDPAILRVSADCLRIIAYGYGFYAVGMVLTHAFNGAGDTFTPTWINAVCFWLVQIPVAVVLAERFAMGPQGVFTSMAVSESLIAVIAILVFRRGTWKRRVV